VTIRATKTALQAILPLRAVFLQETNVQIRYNASHERGWTDSWLLTISGVEVGYGAIKGLNNIRARDSIFEFFVGPPFRKHASALFRELLAASGVAYIECQSNDWLLTACLFEHARNIEANVVLFEDHGITEHIVPGAAVRRRHDADRIFPHTGEPVGDYVVVFDDEVVATGGFLCHYNVPFADLYMEVRADRRRRGFGTLVLQEVKNACYLAGRVPAARCDLKNTASRATLNKAGMRVCGFMLIGQPFR
jgi:GNAT superfamily N-acetyltransferase